MVAEKLGRIREFVGCLDGVLHPSDFDEVRSAHTYVLSVAKSNPHRIHGAANAAVVMLDGLVRSGAYDHDTGEDLDNLAEEFHSLASRVSGN